MYKEDKNLLKEIQEIRNLNHQTIIGYKTTINQYTRLNKKSLTQLIKEAEKEETKNIEWKNRKIRQRLINFRTDLINRNLLYKTVEQYLLRIKTIYRTYEIEIHPLPYISKKNIRTPRPIGYNDLPTKEDLKTVILMSKPVFSALVLFMTSTGCAKKETLSLTIQDLIDSTYRYHNSNNIYDVLDCLKNRNDVIGEWNIYRFKTAKYYVTFSSPEAMIYLVHYLLSRKDKLTPSSVLFKVNDHYISDYFNQMNRVLGLGKAGTYNKLRSHALRKFHASNLYNDGLSLDYVNELQGKAKSRTDSAYFMINPNVLKNEYVRHLGAIMILGGVDGGVWGKLDLSDLSDFSGFYSL